MDPNRSARYAQPGYCAQAWQKSLQMLIYFWACHPGGVLKQGDG
jgi:hypothetical protein